MEEVKRWIIERVVHGKDTSATDIIVKMKNIDPNWADLQRKNLLGKFKVCRAMAADMGTGKPMA